MSAKVKDSVSAQNEIFQKIAKSAHAYRAMRRLFDDAQQFTPDDAYHLCTVRDVLKELFGKIPTLDQALKTCRDVASNHQGILDRRGNELTANEHLGCQLAQEAMVSLRDLLQVPAYRSILFEKKFENWGSFHLLRVGVPLVFGVAALGLGCMYVPFVSKFVVGICVGFFTNETRKYLDRTWSHKETPRSGLFAWAMQNTYRTRASALHLEGEEIPPSAR